MSYGSSIALEKALSPDVILAYEMNDEPLAPEHGFPLRLIVPGYIGARSVKWLREITLQKHTSTNPYQARDYKMFPPEITAKTVDWSLGRTLEDLILNAVITTPQDRRGWINYHPGLRNNRRRNSCRAGRTISRWRKDLDDSQHRRAC